MFYLEISFTKKRVKVFAIIRYMNLYILNAVGCPYVTYVRP